MKEKRTITTEEACKAVDLLQAYATQNEGTCGLLVALKDRDNIMYCCHGSTLNVLTALTGYAIVHAPVAEVVKTAADILRK